MSIALIAAISKNNCIGKSGKLPWHIPKDMERVKKLTRGKIVIIGRKTWESIPKKFRPLPHRVNVIITRNKNYQLPDGVEKYTNIPSAIAAHTNDEIIGFGGQQLFEEMITTADTLYITQVNQTIADCQAFFPTIDPDIWQETTREDYEGFSFIKYSRR